MRTAAADRWRFDRKVVWSPTCLWWVGAIADDGYGRFAAGTGQVMSAHRWLWEQDVGPLPSGVGYGTAVMRPAACAWRTCCPAATGSTWAT